MEEVKVLEHNEIKKHIEEMKNYNNEYIKRVNKKPYSKDAKETIIKE